MDRNVIPSLKERWSRIEAHRGQVAAALERMNAELPRQDRKIVNRVKRWFAGSEGFDSAIRYPDVLSICVPLANAEISSGDPSVAIERSAKLGFCAIGQTLSIRNRLFGLLVYLLVSTLVMAILAVFFSVAVIPGFEQFFGEMTTQLPKMTELVLTLASVIRVTWKYVLAVFCGGVVLALVMNWLTSRPDYFGESWLQQCFKTKRNKAACWSWHVSLLLDSGLSINDAVKVAGEAQRSLWLKRASLEWLEHRTGVLEFYESQKLEPSFGKRYQLIDTTLSISKPAAQVDMFREIAMYYWARNGTISDWWIRLAASFFFWLFVTGVVVAAFSLYSPVLFNLSRLT